MATYRIKGPDGQTYDVTAPDDADQAQVLAYFRSNLGGGAKAPVPAPAKPSGSDLAYKDAQRRNASVGGGERAFVQGAMFNFGDEIDAGAAYLGTAAGNAFKRATGGKPDYSAKDAFAGTMRENRDAEAAYARESGGKATLASIAGGILGPGSKIKLAKELTLAGKARAAALLGGGAGAAYGFGSGDGLEDRLAKAGGGAAGGAVLGAATPYVLAGAGRLAAPVVDPLLEHMRPTIAAVRAAVEARGANVEGRARAAGAAMTRARAERLTKPERRAATALQRALDRDAQAGHAPREDVPLYLGGGENVAGLAELVAQHPGAGKGIMSDAAEESLERNLAGFRGDLSQSLGGRGGYLEHLADLKGERAAAGRGKLEEAFDDTLDADLFNEQFGGLMRRLPKGTWEKAADLARMEGRDPYELGLIRSDTFDGMAAAHLDGAGPGMSPDELLPVETPTLRAAHYVKKALDARLDPMRNPVSGRLNTEGNPEAGAISKLRSEWGRSMRSASPRYDEAMGQWGDDSEVIEGLELGRKALRGGDAWSAEAVAMRHSELSEEAKRQFQRGVGEAILQEARTKGGLSAMRRLLRNEDVADKVRLAFPSPEEFEAFLGTTRQRIADEGRNNRILHNSRTYGRQAAADDLADDGPDVLGTMADVATLDGRGLLRLARRALSERRAQPVLSDQAANPLLAEALTKPEAAARVRRLLAMQKARSLSSRAQGVSGQAVVGFNAGPRD